MMNAQHGQQAEKSEHWSERVFQIITGLGIAGLIAIMAKSAWSAPPPADAVRPPGGFESGPRTFSNPYAPPAPSAGNQNSDSFFDDDDDELVFPEENFPSNPAGAQANAANRGGARPTDVQAQAGGTSLGGGSANGVINAPNAPAALKVDMETAEGCKDIVTDFNFPDADILDIAKTLGKLVGKNFILDKDVKGRVTIISNSPITCGDAWKAFLTALDINGFALIPSGKYIRIARQRDARDKQLRTYSGDFSPDTDALITRVFPLKYLSSEEVARNFRSFMPANARIIPYEQTNTVIVTDTGSNIAKLAKLLDILDVEGYDAGIEVIPVKFASATELAKLIDTLIPGTPTGAPGIAGGGRFGGGGGKFSARRTKEGGIINTIISDDRTNTLIVHANSRGADQVRELVAKLDQKITVQNGGGKIHVVYLQFADSEQISTTLNSLSTGATSAPRTSTGGAGTGSNPVQTSLFEGTIKVAPDKATNSLVITASPSDFATVQRVINKLDIPRDQVFAEVIIMEVNLGKTFDFSSNIINPSSGIGLTPNQDLFAFIANPASAKGATLGFKSGKSINLSVGGQNYAISSLTGLIQAIQSNSRSNILATPQILTLDNTEATFETNERIPVPTVVANQTSTSTSVTKEDIKLSITLKPQINKVSNFVKLDINTKLTDIDNRTLPTAVQNLAFATLERNVKTSVAVADQDTVVLGGLTRDNVQETTFKVPILGDIPLLGWLFKARHSESTKSNLLIFITPRIIRQYEAIRAVLDKALKERDEFIESSTGGDDPNRGKRDNMIRGLPDLKQVLNQKPVTGFTLDPDEVNPTVQSENNPGIERGKPRATPGGLPPAVPTSQNPAAPSLPPGSQVPSPILGSSATGAGADPMPTPPQDVPPPPPQAVRQ